MKLKRVLRRLVAVSIVSGVLALVLGSAGIIVYASVKDYHSSPHYIASEFRDLNVKVTKQNSKSQVEPAISDISKSASPSGTLNCTTNDEIASNNIRYSLVNYLVSKGESASYDHRSELALENNVADYHGSDEQNRQLLTALKLKDSASNCQIN